MSEVKLPPLPPHNNVFGTSLYEVSEVDEIRMEAYRQGYRDAQSSAGEQNMGESDGGSGEAYTDPTPQQVAPQVPHPLPTQCAPVQPVAGQTLAWAIVSADGVPQELLFSPPKCGNDATKYWDEQWPKMAPHRVAELVLSPHDGDGRE